MNIRSFDTGWFLKRQINLSHFLCIKNIKIEAIQPNYANFQKNAENSNSVCTFIHSVNSAKIEDFFVLFGI